MMDLKVLNSALGQLEEERNIPKEKIIEAIEQALAAAYKKDYGKRGQIVRAKFDIDSGKTDFSQIKIVVEPSMLMPEEEESDAPALSTTESEQNRVSPISRPNQDDLGGGGKINDEEEKLIRFNPEHHILLEDAQKIKKDAEPEDEIEFPLETKDDYGRIAAQTAKQVIIQRIREAEKVSVMEEYDEKQGEIVSGTVQRIERGNIFVDLGKTTGILLYDEQIPGERYRQGERIRAYLYSVEETPRAFLNAAAHLGLEHLEHVPLAHEQVVVVWVFDEVRSCADAHARLVVQRGSTPYSELRSTPVGRVVLDLPSDHHHRRARVGHQRHQLIHPLIKPLG